MYKATTQEIAVVEERLELCRVEMDCEPEERREVSRVNLAYMQMYALQGVIPGKKANNGRV